MNARTCGYLCVLTGLFAGFAGCTANKPYRTTLPIPPNLSSNQICPSRTNDGARTYAIEDHGSYKLGLVELDDQGWFWSHRQWDAVKDAIKTEASNNDDGLEIIVFVHGWKNNAAYSDTNVETFRGMLANLNQAIAERDTKFGFNPPRRVFGVYVGWRGLSAASDWFPPLAKELSFYNRKNAAERIGHAGAATQIFTELEVMRDEFNATRTNKFPAFPPTKLVIIGHSFGAALVYSAISDVLTERLVLTTSQKGKIPLRSLGDLVILLSPAFEASLYNNLIALATSYDIQYPTNQRPVLGIFTSRGDWPNKVAFPFGRFFSTLFEKTRRTNDSCLFNIKKESPPDQGSAIRHTVGFDEDYVTYDLDYTNYPKASRAHALDTNPAFSYFTNINHLQDQWTTNKAAPFVFQRSGANAASTNHYACVLAPRQGSKYQDKPENPILNVSVDTRIMAGHDDFANSNLVHFLQDFILFTGTNHLNKAARPIPGR